MSSPSAPGQTILDEGPSTFLSASDASPNVTSFISDASILGLERDISLSASATGASNISGVFDIENSDNPLRIFTELGNATSASATIQWDGVDGSTNLDPTGLGGLDLTLDNEGVEFTLSSDTIETTWTLHFYTDADHRSTFSVTNPSGQSFSDDPIRVLFTDFQPTGSLGSADFTNIGAIELLNIGESGSDTFIENLRFTPVPEPSAGILGACGIAFLLRRRRHIS